MFEGCAARDLKKESDLSGGVEQPGSVCEGGLKKRTQFAAKDRTEILM